MCYLYSGRKSINIFLNSKIFYTKKRLNPLFQQYNTLTSNSLYTIFLLQKSYPINPLVETLKKYLKFAPILKKEYRHLRDTLETAWR